MFAYYSMRNNVSYQAIAMLVVATMLAWTVGANLVGTKAEAANVTYFSDTLSDSRSDQASNHTLDFILPNGMIATETFVVTFDAGFDLTGLATDDVDVAFNGAATTSVAAAAGAGVFGATFAAPDAQSITFTSPTGGVASGTRLTITIGTNSVIDTVGNNQITNPTATTTSYTIDILAAGANPIQDAGQTRVAITDNVLVTAAVNTTFDFVVNGTDAGFPIPGVATATAATTTSYALPFGTLTAGVSKTLAHQLNVTTNAANGFVVTVEQTGELLSSTGAIIDSFTDGAYENDPSANATWVHPTGNISQDNTWGHWGLTSDDDVFNSGTNDGWVAASTTPRLIFSHSSSTLGTNTDIGSTTVGYQIEITSLQEAGNDYSTNLIYIATPTF